MKKNKKNFSSSTCSMYPEREEEILSKPQIQSQDPKPYSATTPRGNTPQEQDLSKKEQDISAPTE